MKNEKVENDYFEFKKSKENDIEQLKDQIKSVKKEKSLMLGPCTDVKSVSKKIKFHLKGFSETYCSTSKIDDIISDTMVEIRNSVKEKGEKLLDPKTQKSKMVGQFLAKKIKNSYFCDLKKGLDQSESIPEIIKVLVTEISCSRMCINDLISSMDTLMVNLAEKEITNKF